jgi:parvulin-like peptidyl-prolyl isomerase
MPPKNKKYLAQKQKEERQKKIIIIATISVLVIVFGLVVYGVLDRYVLKPQKTVLELEGFSINANEFEQQARWLRRSKIMEVDQILSTVQQLGGTPEVFNYFEESLQTAVSDLQQPLILGQQVLQALSQDLILRVEAEKMGIEISEEEVDRSIEEAFGYYAEGTPTPAATLPPTNTPEAETEDSAPDPTATPLLKPTEYTEELFSENFQEFLDSIKNDGITEETVRSIVEMSLIRQKLNEMVTADVDRVAEQVHIQHILVEDEETALEVLQKLDDGEVFSDLAQEYSIDEASKTEGGDLGWFSRGAMVETFEEAAFSLEVGEISQPVETDFGFHILESLGKEERDLNDNAYQQIQNQYWNEWLANKQAEYEPEINEDWFKFVPSEPTLPADYVSFIQSLLLEQPELPSDIPQE